MPLDSMQIAQMNGAYTSLAQNQMAYSQQLSQGGPPGYGGGSGAYGDQVMGRAMNAGAAIGGPMASIGGALAPMAIGSMFGMGALASTGIGIPIAAGMAAMSYAGGQAMSGAQQQQGLNAGLRSSFGFQNQYGGSGFTRPEMTQIGTQLRGMSSQFGAGGEIASFGELSQVAQKMGGMGLTQGVKDVAEFGKKFKETVTALKTMAKDLGTTLEGALEFAGQARSSGIFGMQNVSKFTSMARGTAVAGGLAMSEVTGMANIGSQISRSVGGLGRQGAVAGMKTIGQIGTAQQMGVLSEEDIYNVTGQTGAEGRQSYAASQMQKSANFLQSNKGRRLLASIAGKNGSLDPEGVMELMSGGMDIGETMKRDNIMKEKVGRANFIRNEGRLRGAAMQEFGAFLPGMQMMQWAASKGVDINNMDDRSMLFAQRQLGMGRDEVDQAVKMAQNMPRIMEEMKSKQGMDSFNQSRAQAGKQHGVEGIKTRFEQAKQKVNNALQKVGQDFFNEGSEMLDNFLSKVTGDYEKAFSESAVQAYQQSTRGGGGSELARSIGAGSFSRGAGSIGGGGAGGGIAGFNRGSTMSKYGGMVGGILGGASDSENFAKAGFKVTAKTDADLRSRLGEISDISRAANEPASDKYLALGTSSPQWLRDAYSSGAISGQGEDRIAAFDKVIGEKGTAEQKAAWAAAKSPVEKARMVSGMAASVGVSSEGANFGMPAVTSGLFGANMTQSEKLDAISRSFGAGKTSGGEVATSLLGGALGGVLGPLGQMLGSALGSRLGARTFGTKDQDRATAQFLMSDEGATLAQKYLGKDQGTLDAMTKEMADIQGRVDRGEATSDEKGRLEGMRGLKAAAAYQDLITKAGGDPSKVSQDALKKAASDNGMSVEEFVRKSQTVGAVLTDKEKTAWSSIAQAQGKMASDEITGLTKSGVATYQGGKLSLTGSAAAKFTKGQSEATNSLLRATALKEQAGHATSPDEQRRLLMQASDLEAGYQKGLEGMSVADQKALAKAQSSVGLEGEAEGTMARAASQQRLTTGVHRKGGAQGIADYLGAGLDKDQRAALKASDNPDVQAHIIASSLGIKDASKIKEALTAAGKGGAGLGSATTALRQLEGSDEFRDAKKKQSLDAAAEKDPLQAEANKHLEAIRKTNERSGDYLKLIVQHTAGTTEALAALDKKDAEDAKASPAKQAGT